MRTAGGSCISRAGIPDPLHFIGFHWTVALFSGERIPAYVVCRLVDLLWCDVLWCNTWFWKEIQLLCDKRHKLKYARNTSAKSRSKHTCISFLLAPNTLRHKRKFGDWTKQLRFIYRNHDLNSTHVNVPEINQYKVLDVHGYDIINTILIILAMKGKRYKEEKCQKSQERSRRFGRCPSSVH